MSLSDAVLFDKWRNTKDADAFAELLSRHATMVYGTCLRVVKNASVAEDVAQECFLELMKGPRGVRSIGGWLHTVATRRALDRLKAEGRRAKREENYAATVDSTTEATWDDTREYVDEAIAALPEELRVPIVLRFLEGQAQKDIAEELSVSRSTVRLRIDKGIGLIRESLAERGILCAVAALTTMFECIPADAAPATLLSELGKRALAQRPAPGLVAKFVVAKYALVAVPLLAIVSAAFWSAFDEQRSSALAGANEGVAAAAHSQTPPETPSASEASLATPEIPRKNAVAEAEKENVVSPLATEIESKTGWRLDLTPSEKMLQAMKANTNVEFQDIHIKDVLEFIQDSSDINVVLDSRVVAPEPSPYKSANSSLPRSYVTDGHVRYVNQRNEPMDEMLAVLTTPLNLTCKIRGNAVWVSSSWQITQDMTVPLPSATFSEAKILDVLNSPVNIEFEDIHIFDILEFLQQSFKIKIVADKRVIMPKFRAGEKPLARASSYTSDGMVSYINLKDTSLAETLFVITRLLNLSYRVAQDAVYISTPPLLKAGYDGIITSTPLEGTDDDEAIQPSVSGTVMLPDGQPFTGAQVAVQQVAELDSRKGRFVTKVDTAGQFSVYGLEPGEYRIQIVEPTMNGWSDDIEFARFTLVPGESKDNLDFVFGTEGNLTISGTVVDSAGTPIEGVNVTVDGPVPRGDATDKSGQFTLRFLPEGEVMLSTHTRRSPYAASEQPAIAGEQDVRIELMHRRADD